jgi:hypothetical protein
LRPYTHGRAPASAPTSRRQKADRLATPMRAFAAQLFAYRAGL